MNIFIARAEDFKRREREAKQASKQCKEAEAVKQCATKSPTIIRISIPLILRTEGPKHNPTQTIPDRNW
jgi:hypothetical protein